MSVYEFPSIYCKFHRKVTYNAYFFNWKYVCSCALVTYKHTTNWYISFSASITHIVQSNQTLIKVMFYLCKKTCHVIVAIHKGRARKNVTFFVNRKDPKINNTMIAVIINYNCVKISKDSNKVSRME